MSLQSTCSGDNDNNIMEALRSLLLVDVSWKVTLIYFISCLFQKQILQTLSILINCVKNETSLYYLLSNNYINEIIIYPHDFSNDEGEGLCDQFVSFLKTLSLKLNVQTVQFFFIERTGAFPLLSKAIELLHSNEPMVRTAAQATVLNVYQVKNDAKRDLFSLSLSLSLFLSFCLSLFMSISLSFCLSLSLSLSLSFSLSFSFSDTHTHTHSSSVSFFLSIFLFLSLFLSLSLSLSLPLPSNPGSQNRNWAGCSHRPIHHERCPCQLIGPGWAYGRGALWSWGSSENSIYGIYKPIFYTVVMDEDSSFF